MKYKFGHLSDSLKEIVKQIKEEGSEPDLESILELDKFLKEEVDYIEPPPCNN